MFAPARAHYRTEQAFYSEGLKQFTLQDFVAAGYSADLYQGVQNISTDESAHVSFLKRTIGCKPKGAPSPLSFHLALTDDPRDPASGGLPAPQCHYNFSIPTARTFLAMASVFEGVGISAYAGAASYLDKNTSAATTILSVEARHSAYLRSAALREQPFPTAFDTPLDFASVHTLILPYIPCCDTSAGQFPAIPGLKANAALGVEVVGATANFARSVVPNQTVTLIAVDNANATEEKGQAPLFAAWLSGSPKPDYVLAQRVKAGSSNATWFEAAVSSKAAGQSYVFLTRGNDSFADSNIVAGPAMLEIGD